MKKFLLKITYFLILLIGINTILFVVGKKIYFGNYHDYSLNFNSYLLSDSHGMPLENFTEKYGIYNFSDEGDSYIDMLRKIKYLIKKTNIDSIYITVDDHTLSPYRENSNNLDRSQLFTTPEDYSNYYEYFKQRYLKNYVVLFQPKTRSVIRHYIISELMNVVSGNKKNTAEDKEINWAELGVDERLKSSKIRFEYQFPTDIESHELHQSLEDIINVCKLNNIELIGVKFPLSSDYIEISGNKTYGADKILQLEGFKVLDFKKVFINQDRYFADPDHLNEEGGHSFVELLLNDKKSKTLTHHH